MTTMVIVALIVIFGAALVVARDWPLQARIGPQIVLVTGLTLALFSLLVELFRGEDAPAGATDPMSRGHAR